MYLSDFTFQIIKYVQLLLEILKLIEIKEIAGIFAMRDDLCTLLVNAAGR